MGLYGLVWCIITQVIHPGEMSFGQKLMMRVVEEVERYVKVMEEVLS